MTGPSGIGFFNLHFWEKSPEDESHKTCFLGFIFLFLKNNKGGLINEYYNGKQSM